MRLRVMAAVLALSLAMSVASAAAGSRDGGGAEVVDGRPVAVVVVGRDGPVASWSATGARSGPAWTCRYFEWEDDAAVPVTFADEATTPRAGRLYLLTCVTASGALAVGRLVVFDPGDPFSGVAAVGTGPRRGPPPPRAADPATGAEPPAGPTGGCADLALARRRLAARIGHRRDRCGRLDRHGHTGEGDVVDG